MRFSPAFEATILVGAVVVGPARCGAASAYLRDALAKIRIGIFLSLATTTGALIGVGAVVALEAVLAAGGHG